MSQTQLLKFLKPVQKLSPETEELCASREDLCSALLALESAVVPEDVPSITELSDAFSDFAVKVSLIGQVKAGKTALTNALLGETDLLPSDVNPWTSVVTSMHINRIPPKGKRAIFKFFDATDWDDLVSDSGRIVKLARKAKLDSRVDELTSQIEELKARTEERLGRNFKMLLGNQHSFSSFQSDLVKRYVCLGEEDGSEEREGRFADLTKCADLYLENDNFNYPISIADTPGVNDPFLVREAATLDNLGNSDIFVVVLSAHQALSSVDLGLLRLLKSLHSNRLIVFVNRIDELQNPQEQICEIRSHISSVLEQQRLSGDIPIIFGSAAWADAAVRDGYEHLPGDSIGSLGKLVEAREASLDAGATDVENIENLTDVSGISALRAIIHRKAWDEVFDREISRQANRARQIADRSAMYLSQVSEGPKFQPDVSGIQNAVEQLDKGTAKIAATLSKAQKSSQDKIKMDMAAAYMSFIKKEKAALNNCLSTSGKVADWSPDTEGLRSELNGIYAEYTQETMRGVNSINAQLISLINEAYTSALGTAEGLRITPLTIPDVPIPLALMRTMSIDMRASSSLEWLRRKLDKAIYSEQLASIASADLRSTVHEICADAVEPYFEKTTQAFQDLLKDHRETISALARTGDASLQSKLKDLLEKGDDISSRLMTLNATSDILHALENASLEDTRVDLDAFVAAPDEPLEAAE
ncbi:MAG: dynamin family protein [Pseudomonadota bacterium]